LGGRGRQISEFEASLVYRVSSRTARATQRNPVSKNQKKKKKYAKLLLKNIEVMKNTYDIMLCSKLDKLEYGRLGM
jgi:hypothetical protein